MENTIMITDFAQFYRAVNSEGSARFYPNTSNLRNAALDWDAAGDPPVVSGFAVYDTSISTEYAVAIYATKLEAEQHEATPPTKGIKDIFDEQTPPNDTALSNKKNTDALDNPSTPSKAERQQTKKTRNERR